MRIERNRERQPDQTSAKNDDIAAFHRASLAAGRGGVIS